MYCKNCGSYMNDSDRVCSKCGTMADNNSQMTSPYDNSYNNNYYNGNQYPQQPKEGNTFLYGALGCCFPMVGLILFLVWKDTKVQSAKSAGIGAIIGFVSSFVLGFIAGLAGLV